LLGDGRDSPRSASVDQHLRGQHDGLAGLRQLAAER
jgi:hypothetical protein